MRSKSKILKSNRNLLFADPLSGDLTEFINSGGWQSTHFELSEKKDKVISLRLSSKLLAELKKQAKIHGLDMQKFVRIILENTVRKKTG